jgi:hypothetical protein
MGTFNDPEVGEQTIVRRRQKKPVAASAVKPITWHDGWAKIDTQAGPEPLLSGEYTAESSKRPTELQSNYRHGLGLQHRVELFTEPPNSRSDGSQEPAYLSICVEQPDGEESGPRVLVSLDEGLPMAATVEEARRFALEILALIEEYKS